MVMRHPWPCDRKTSKCKWWWWWYHSKTWSLPEWWCILQLVWEECWSQQCRAGVMSQCLTSRPPEDPDFCDIIGILLSRLPKAQFYETWKCWTKPAVKIPWHRVRPLHWWPINICELGNPFITPASNIHPNRGRVRSLVKAHQEYEKWGLLVFILSFLL